MAVFLRDHSWWSASWDKRHAIWRVAEDDPEEDSRASAELDPVWRKLWEDGARDVLPRAETWLREAAPAITARLCQPG